jgi:hypothetical protein
VESLLGVMRAAEARSLFVTRYIAPFRTEFILFVLAHALCCNSASSDGRRGQRGGRAHAFHQTLTEALRSTLSHYVGSKT